MFSIYLIAGLGNQFFQLFTALAYAIEYKKRLVIPSYKLDIDKRPPYWDSIFKKLKEGVDSNLKVDQLTKHKEGAFHYTPIPDMNHDFILFGYFQSYKYFDKHFDTIMRRLNLKLEQEMIKAQYLTLKNSISLHFRIGDFSSIQLHHPLITDHYYINAIHHIFKMTNKDNWDIIYFCEEKDNLAVKKRLTKIKSHFPNIVFHKASDELKDWEQLLLMSCSDHNIIANSTFSWWAAYLNQNKDKIICYPSRWFGSAYTMHDTKDLFPPTWTKIKDSIET